MKRLVKWNTREDCKAYHGRIERPGWYVEGLVDRSMVYGNIMRFADDVGVEEFRNNYNVEVY